MQPKHTSMHQDYTDMAAYYKETQSAKSATEMRITIRCTPLRFFLSYLNLSYLTLIYFHRYSSTDLLTDKLADKHTVTER